MGDNEAFSMSCHVNLQSLLLPIAIFFSFIVEIILNACLIYLYIYPKPTYKFVVMQYM
jgi:hypothetical protein